MFARIASGAALIYGKYDARTSTLVEIGSLGPGGWGNAYAGMKHNLSSVERDKLEPLTAESFDSNDQAAGFEVVDGKVVESEQSDHALEADAHPGEDFPTYLRRVAGDFAESGNDATADDYKDCALRIERVLSILQRWEEKTAPNAPAGIASIRELLTTRETIRTTN